MENGPRTLKTIDRGLEILDYLQEIDGARLNEIAEHADMTPSTAYRYLVTLQENTYVVKEGDRYYPSLKFLDVAHYVGTRKQVYELADQYTERVHSETGFRSAFLVEERGRGVYISWNFGGKTTWRHPYRGFRCPLHNRAGGKAILSRLSTDQVRKIIDQHGLPATTDNTITKKGELFDELERVSEQGVAFNRQEQETDVKAIGVPVVPEDDVVGALTLGGAASNLDGKRFESELPQMLQDIAADFELALCLDDE